MASNLKVIQDKVLAMVNSLFLILIECEVPGGVTVVALGVP